MAEKRRRVPPAPLDDLSFNIVSHTRPSASSSSSSPSPRAGAGARVPSPLVRAGHFVRTPTGASKGKYGAFFDRLDGEKTAARGLDVREFEARDADKNAADDVSNFGGAWEKSRPLQRFGKKVVVRGGPRRTKTLKRKRAGFYIKGSHGRVQSVSHSIKPRNHLKGKKKKHAGGSASSAGDAAQDDGVDDDAAALEAAAIGAGDGDGEGDGAAAGGDALDTFDAVAAAEERSHHHVAQVEAVDVSDAELDAALRAVGLETFRPGQREAVRHVMKQESSLVVMPTGGGKSLCYYLPAVLRTEPSLVLVVSPLVSLMLDQLRNLPPCVGGAALYHGQAVNVVETMLGDVRRGNVRILFVSPERLVSPAFLRLTLRLPPIQCVCIDEAHCVSEWSHNFRPAYLRMSHVIRNVLHVPCVLALTATATPATERSVCEHLKIPPGAVIRRQLVRDNLKLSVSPGGEARYRALPAMLRKGGRLADCSSVIVYTLTRDAADNVAQRLRCDGLPAEAYHAGMDHRDRRRVQQKFTNNTLRIVVATVAFGMGLNKVDVRAVVHFGMPRSLESYVQEIGRAGRDGEPAWCHLFIDDDDYLRLRSYSHSDGVDTEHVARVLDLLFATPPPVKYIDNEAQRLERSACDAEYADPDKPLVALPHNEVEAECDMRKEVTETVLSWVHLDGRFGELLDDTDANCSIRFYKTKPDVLAGRHRVIRAVLKNCTRQGHSYMFDLISVARAMVTSVRVVRRHLWGLQKQREISFALEKKAFVMRIKRMPTADEKRELVRKYAKLLSDLERAQEHRVDQVYVVMDSVKVASSTLEPDDDTHELHDALEKYFACKDGVAVDEEHLPVRPYKDASDMNVLMRGFLRRFQTREAPLTARAVARVFMGISSTSYPASSWYHTKYWGMYRDCHFDDVKAAATLAVAMRK